MSWNAFFGITSVMFFLIPVAVIIVNRYYMHRSLAALMIYYIMTALYNMMYLNIIPADNQFRLFFGIFTNYLDAPLMLMVLLFFCPIRQKQQKIYFITFIFLAYEIIITCFHGFSRQSVIYILGPGMGIILLYSSYLFAKHMKFTIMHSKNTGRTIMLASILFSYSCYYFIYYFFYIEKAYIMDSYLLYFISSIISSVLMSIGLIMTNKRLKKLNDLKTTRKELHLFFNT